MGRSASFKGSSAEDTLQPRATAQAGGSGSLLRSGRGLRLGLGAVTRTTTGSAKGRGPGQGQRSTLVFSQPIQPVSPATSQKSQDNTGLKKKKYYLLQTTTIFLVHLLSENNYNTRWRWPLVSYKTCQISFQQPKIGHTKELPYPSSSVQQRAVVGLFPPQIGLR